MPRLQHKPLAKPEQVRRFEHGRIEIVSLDEWVVSNITFEPGWRWSKDVRPIVGTEWCENRHLGVVLQGRFHVELEDGTSTEFQAGDVYEMPPGHDAWVVGDETFLSYEFASGRIYALAPDDEGNRRVATLLFTDIVDSTAELARLGDRAWREVLIRHNEVVRGALDQFRGREVVTTGDGFLAVFDSAARAVRAALAIGRDVRAVGVELRAGIHTGEIEEVGGNVRGLAVHLAARVMAAAGAGEVLVSATTAELATGSSLRFESVGFRDLKGVEGARELFRAVPLT